MDFSCTFAPGVQAGLQRRVLDALSRLAQDGAGRDVLRGDVTVEVLSGGAMNLNFVLRTATEDLVLRLAGDHVERFGVDRARSVDVHRVWEAAGVSPRLFAATLPDGNCLSRFLPARTLDRGALSTPGVVEACARAVSVAHHSARLPGTWSIFDDARRYFGTARAEGLELPEDATVFEDALEAIDRSLATADVPSVLAHNDLQIQNYMVDGEDAWLIDLEYAAMASPYLDLGMLAHYGGLTPARRRSLLLTYFGVHREVDEHRLLLFHVAAAVREAAWSVCAQPTLGHTGWDYAAWGRSFFDRARAVLRSPGFAERVQRAGRVPDDARTFESAAARAADLAPRFRERAGLSSAAVGTRA